MFELKKKCEERLWGLKFDEKRLWELKFET